jgi:hypothetical protein
MRWQLAASKLEDDTTKKAAAAVEAVAAKKDNEVLYPPTPYMALLAERAE